MVSKPAARKAGPQRRSKQHAAVSQDPPGREAQPQPSSSTAQTDRIPGRPTQNERSAGVHGSGKPSRGAEHVPQRSAGTNHRLTSAQGHERSADGALAVGPPRGKGKVGKSSQSAGQPLGPAGERLPSGGSPSRAVSGRPAQGASVPKEAPRARSKTTDQKERHLRQGQPPPQSQARPGQGQTRPGPDSSSSAAQSKGRRQMDPREKYLKKAQMVKAAKFKQEAPSAPNGCPAHKTEDRRTPEGSGDMLRSASAGSLGAEGEPRRPTDLRNPGDPRSPSRTKGVSEPRSQRSDKNTPKSATVGAAVGTRLQVHRNPESANVGANSSVRTTELENVENTEAISRVANVAAPGVSQQQQVKSPTIVPPEVKRTELRNPESIITGESSQDRLDNSGATVSAPIEPTPIEGNAVPSQTFPSEQEGGHSGCTGETDQGNLYQLEDNKRDIARITVNARAEVARIHVGLGAHSTEPSSSAEARTSGVLSAVNPLFSASRMAPAPPQSNSPASYNAVNGDSGSSRDAQGIVELSSLQLDIVSQGADNGGGSPEESPIQTHHINAGVGATRGESNQALPDILNSHILPPYTVRQNQHRASRQNNRNRINQQRAQRHGTPNPGLTQLEDAEKGCCNHECCLGCVTVVTTFRWVLVSLAMLGVCCVVTGIILGALHMTVGSSFLTLSLMFIGKYRTVFKYSQASLICASLIHMPHNPNTVPGNLFYNLLFTVIHYSNPHVSQPKHILMGTKQINKVWLYCDSQDTYEVHHYIRERNGRSPTRKCELVMCRASTQVYALVRIIECQKCN